MHGSLPTKNDALGNSILVPVMLVDENGNPTGPGGGTVAATETTLAAINTATGAVADATWSGTGNGTLVSILKAIWSRLNITK